MQRFLSGSILVAIAATAGCGGARAAGPPPEAPAACCRELTTVYEASLFQIDVMRVSFRVDEATAGAVRQLVSRTPRSPALEHEVAGIYLDARSASADTEFLMAMSGEMFVDNTIKALRGLVRDSLLAAAEADTLSGEARLRFAFLASGGVRPADRLEYDLAGDTVRTTYLRSGQVLMQDRQIGERYRRALLASYFAPSSEFRRGLLHQVLVR